MPQAGPSRATLVGSAYSRSTHMLTAGIAALDYWGYQTCKEFAFYLSAGLLFTSALICGAAWLAQRAAAPPRSTAAPAAE